MVFFALNSSGSIKDVLGPFWISLLFVGIIRVCWLLCDACNTAESILRGACDIMESNSVVHLRHRRVNTQWCLRHHGVKLRGALATHCRVNTQWCLRHHGVKLRGASTPQSHICSKVGKLCGACNTSESSYNFIQPGLKHKILKVSFFHGLIVPLRLLIHLEKYFRLWWRFHGDILKNWFTFWGKLLGKELIFA